MTYRHCDRQNNDQCPGNRRSAGPRGCGHSQGRCTLSSSSDCSVLGRRSVSWSSLWLDGYHRPTAAADQPGRKPSRRPVRMEQLRKKCRDPLVRAGQRVTGHLIGGCLRRERRIARRPGLIVGFGPGDSASAVTRSIALSAVQDRSDRHLPPLQFGVRRFPRERAGNRGSS